MIQVKFFRQGNAVWGFSESGHAAYAESGDDIVCAAVSAMTMLVINTAEEVDEKTTDVTVRCADALPSDDTESEPKQFAVSGLFYGYYLQLMDMLEDYYDYLDVSLIEKEFDG